MKRLKKFITSFFKEHEPLSFYTQCVIKGRSAVFLGVYGQFFKVIFDGEVIPSYVVFDEKVVIFSLDGKIAYASEDMKK